MSEPQAVRFGVLGCSSVARRRFLPSLARSSAELVAVASRDAGRAKEFAASFGCVAAGDYHELLARTDVDAVYVSVPTGLHHRWALAALTAGKHVLVEKPLATSRAEGAELFALARERGLVVMENRMFAHHTQHEAVAALVADGAIGEPRVLTAAMAIPALPADDVRYRPELGGGALLDVGYYPLHAAVMYCGEDVAVAGVSRHFDENRGVDVAGSVLLRGGVDAHVTYGFRHAYRTSYELWGDGGRITLDRAFTPPETWQPVLRLERQNSVELRTLPACDQFRTALEFFTAAVHGDDLTVHNRRTLAVLGLFDAIAA